VKKSTDQQVLTEAHHDFSRGLVRYANLKVNNTALSDDLVQTTFMKTWLYLQNTGKIDLMRAFLYHALNGLIIDEYRKKKALSLDLLAENGLELAAINSENIYNIIDGKIVAALIHQLPEKYRAVITMRFLEELSLKEMSAATNQSQNAVSVQIHRGLVRLKALSVA
jgi:RNA polymerase sigma-70 factor (ECF subfamily)